MKKFGLIAMGVFAGLAGLAMPAKAQDASWGCQVLLCAASSNPSWHGVPYCVPPMTRLIAAMKLPGFSWPICPEGKAGKPGFEKYGDCPAGMKIAYTTYEGTHSYRNEPDRCEKPRERPCSKDERENGCSSVISMARPLRTDPYYFDIPNEQGVKQRFWFNLDR